jgi:hypothetical protein
MTSGKTADAYATPEATPTIQMTVRSASRLMLVLLQPTMDAVN